MTGKSVSASAIVMGQRMLPQDANPAGNVHGGVLLKHIDLTGAVAAMRHARSAVVTKSIDRMEFRAPVRIGELVLLKASVNYAGRSSMEIGVRVETEDLFTGEVRHAASAYLTFIAMGPDGKPREVPELICENEHEERRYREALARRETRKAEIARESASQHRLE